MWTSFQLVAATYGTVTAYGSLYGTYGMGSGVGDTTGAERRDIQGKCSDNILYLLEFPLDLLMAVIVGGFTWYKSQMALKAVDDGEARLVLLPSYRVVLLSYVAVVVLFGASTLVRYMLFTDGSVDLLSWGSTLLLWAWHVGVYLVIDGVAYWLTQHSAGLATMKKVAWRTFFWAAIRGNTLYLSRPRTESFT